MSAPIIGLTGGIGCGKSTVARLFAARGIAVVDTDAIAHALTARGGEALPAIAAAFGAAVFHPDGTLDRAALRRLVFADAKARARLEGLLHPRIRAQALAECAAAPGPYVLLAVPLLVETGVLRESMRRVLVVDCDEATQLARVIARSGLSADETRAIVAAQVPRTVRRAAADDLIDNSGDAAALAPAVARLDAAYRALAR